MKNKTGLVLILGIFLVGLMSASSVCCERLEAGGWCLNADAEDCDASFRSSPTSCESTSYCRMGTCVNVQKGTCMENTPQRVCEENEGFWKDEPAEEIAQCNLGCCLIGDQAAFVTQTKCKRLSAFYGLETNFRTNINSEFECIATATSEKKGACVFESEFEKTCKMTTRKECQSLETNVPSSIFDLFDSTPEEVNKVSFYEGKLCSAEELGTNCGPSRKTTCVEGKDGVYFLDTCGNLANIYDSSKADDSNYWAEIINIEDSCGYGNSNGGSASCGNCDYYLGSTCKKKDGQRVNVGDYICEDLGCNYNGKDYKHGETWCAEAESISDIEAGKQGDVDVYEENLPGSRYYRMVCYNGEVTVEPCADYRQEVCVESEVNGFSVAACKANVWEDCYAQDEEDDCLNIDKRDCKWISTGVWDSKDVDDDENTNYIYACVPNYAPGFNFWEEESDAEELCSIASEQCVVKYEKGIGGGWHCVENCHCCHGYDGCTGDSENWEAQKITFCSSLGDCGFKLNYLGGDGKLTLDDLFQKNGDDYVLNETSLDNQGKIDRRR